MGSCKEFEIDEILAIQKREESLIKLMQETGCEIIQENGQRKFGGPPPNWEGPPPPKGTEIFVGKLPRDVFEDELYRIFSTIGPIYELRLMMDFSGSNRGFAFIQFAHRQDANRAIQLMDNYELRPRHHIGVVKSIDNCRLFIGGIPKTKSREEIQGEMERLTEGVTKVIVYSSITDKTKNRGFAFVEYINHRAASKARRKLIPDRIQLWGKEIAVDWAEPENEIEEDVMSQVTVLYVRNLSLTTTEQVLRELFNRVSDDNVQKLKMMRDFAFIHFSSREKAEKAMRNMNHTEINGTTIEITWAKPVKEKKAIKSKPPSRKTSSVSMNSVSSTSSYSPCKPAPKFALSAQNNRILSSPPPRPVQCPPVTLPPCTMMQQLPHPLSNQIPNVFTLPPPFHGGFQSSPTGFPSNSSTSVFPHQGNFMQAATIDLNGNRNYNTHGIMADTNNRMRKTTDPMMFTNFGPPLHPQPNWMAEERSRSGMPRDSLKFPIDGLNAQFHKLGCINNLNRVGFNGNVSVNPFQIISPFPSRPMMP
ncbi:probable RNA-binding protein 46 [Daphnia pulicaria]|uniref:probable RNA-binding protein 46 n=1 Tax=Daphnia pulicaria TaxID=35523 RepID=UPI001EEAF555|nr:probable RNA-binding protein 46 [Daphnia pulicaria]